MFAASEGDVQRFRFVKRVSFQLDVITLMLLTRIACTELNVAEVVTAHPTLRAPLSGTFLQTLLDLVTSLNRGTLYLCAAVHRRGQRPPKGSGTNMTVEAT